MKLFEVYPLQNIVLEKAKGAFVWDQNGQQYLDMYGGHAVISIGHSHPHYLKRIKDQLDNIGFYSNSVHIPAQEELAELLGRLSGKPDYQLFLCNSGAEANENALKLASFHNGRKRIVAFSGGFHGRTSLAVAVTDNPAISAPVNQTDIVDILPFNDENALESFFLKHGDEISSVIVEGIQGVGGIRIASDTFLQSIEQLCQKYGAIFIADSVQCGYGRTGRFFSHDHANVKADIYTMAKGMGNGFPIGGVMIAPHIKAKFGMLGTTFGGNHLACAAALAVLEVIESEQLISKAVDIGARLMDNLRAFPFLENVRGKGLMIGFDVPDSLKSLRNDLLFKHHIFTGEAKPNIIRLLPSLALEHSEADQFLEAMSELIQEFPIG
jgi:acetylornithine/N-succinyldiaminopimelate aminotransferase